MKPLMPEIEPKAKLAHQDDEQSQYLYSIAISLKRIADGVSHIGTKDYQLRLGDIASRIEELKSRM